LITLLAAVLASVVVSGTVFDDANANGRRDPAEKGLASVAVSDGVAVVPTGADGTYRLDAAGRNVFVILPGDRRAVGSFWRVAASEVDFPLAPMPVGEPWRFAHLSDPHIHPENVERMRRALALVAQQRADFAVVTGDLNKDALRVDEPTARARLGLYASEAAKASVPVRSAPGNHDIFGIERHLSLVPTTNAAYGKALYEEILGPRYYAFNRGKVHFIVLDTLGVDDLWYYGYLEADELSWLKKELVHVPPGTTVVTAGHVPLRTGGLWDSFESEGPGRTLMTVKGETFFRHAVRNVPALLEILKPYRFTLALQGHTHQGERLRLFDGGDTRFHTAPSVDRTPDLPSGLFIYSVRGSEIDDGAFLPLDPP
jgi:Icc protein